MAQSYEQRLKICDFNNKVNGIIAFIVIVHLFINFLKWHLFINSICTQ